MMRAWTFLLALPLFVWGCSSGPDPIVYGKDNCHWCQMRIMDPKFGAEAITAKGRIYKFDSGECLLHYINEAEVEHSHLLVTDFESPETLMDATTSYFLVSKNMPSPMGAYLNAFPDETTAQGYQKENGGTVFSWESIKADFAQ